MKKIKSNLKKILTYVASTRSLKYSLIIIILLIPSGVILTNKFFNNKEITKQELSESKDKNIDKKNDKKTDVATGDIKTDAVAAQETSTYKLSDGYTEASKSGNFGSSSDKKNDKKTDVATGDIKTDAVAAQETSTYKLSDGYTEASKSGNFGSSSSSNSNNQVNSSSNTTINKDKSSLSGMDLEVLEGHEFNPKKDLRLKATDKDGRNISDNIIIEKNTVNTKIPGVYTVIASVRLSDGQKKEKEFTVTVKETRLDVVLESFKPVKESAKKGENIVFDLDLNVSKNHITPTLAMINGKEYTLYKGEERIFDKLANKKRYKVIINASDIAGIHQFNLEHVKMSNGSWISVGENIANVEVLKDVASIKNFTYEEQSRYKRVKANFNLEDIDNTASNLKLEFYKDNELVKTEILDKKSDYEVYLPTTSNGKYDFKILADVNLTQGIAKNNTSKETIFNATVSVSNINQSSLIGKNADIIQGDNFDPVKDLSLKATDFDGEDITDKIVVEDNNLNTNVVGASDIAGVQEFNLEHVKMSNGSWISLGENIANVEVLKEVASVKNFTYEEQSLYKRVKAKFNLEDIDSTASKLKLEFYKDNELLKTQMLDKKSEYEVYLPTTSNGKYDFKILADLSLTQGISRYNESKEAIFATSIYVSNINQSSLIGKDAEIIQGDKFNPIEDLSLKATDFDGEDITDKIVIEKENIDTKEVGKHTVLAHVVITQGISRYNESKEAIFATSIYVSNINQSSLIGKDAEIIQGDKFNPIEDLSLKATDFDGEDITDKIVIEKENIDTKEVGKHTVLAHVVNKRNQKYSKELYVNIKPVAEVIEFNPIKDEFGLDENVSFEIKLKNKRDNAVAEKAIINGKVVNLVYDKFRNSLGNIKTYSANIGTEDSEGNKEYVISKIIMKDGKEFTLNKVSNVDIFSEDTKKDLQSRLRIDRELFDNKESKALTKTTQSRATINGNDSETLNQSVTIKGSVSKKDGSAPDGRLEVELPTAMSFAVDQNGAFTPGSYTITNKSSVGITVSIAKFTETIPRGGINVKPIGDALSNRADVNLALVGDKGYADLGKPIDGRKELLDVNPLGVGTIQLLGQAGNGSDENIDNKGASEDFTLVFQIKKKD